MAILAMAGTVTGATPPNVLDYDLDLRLFPAEHRIAGRVVITSPAQPLTPPLHLDGKATVDSVAVDGQIVAFTLQEGRLHWPQAGRSIAIRYRAEFNDPLPQDTVGIEDPSFGVRAVIQPQGTYLAESVAWFPQRREQPGRHRVRIAAADGMVAVTAGRLLGQETVDGLTVCTWQNDFPLAGLALAAGSYKVGTGDLDGIQLLTFLTADNARLADAYLAAMRRHLAFYQDLLGPYPFAKFAVVENFLPTGYGMPSWTLLGRNVVTLPFILDTSLPHEIVHSWWGNAVAVDYAHGNWAEGLATYLADYLLKERGQPAEALAYRQKILRDYAALVDAQRDFPLRAFSGRTDRAEQAIGYGKGAMVFHLLRRQIGEQAFWQGLREMAGTGSGKLLGWPDLERIFATSAGQDLRWFFRQWVEQAGAPELALADVRATSAGADWSVSGLVHQAGTPYRLSLPLRLTMAGGETMEQTIPLTGSSTPFQLTATGRPQRLEADPAVDLFRRLAPAELPATVNDLTVPNRPLVVIAAGQRQLLEAARPLLKGLHWEAAEIRDETGLDPPVLEKRDLLLLGWPQRPELRPALPAPLIIDAAAPPGWRVAGQPAGGDALFAVLDRRQWQRSSRALLLAATPPAVRAMAAKVSHYGRYSLLLFDAGRNVHKSTWTPTSSPLIFAFPEEP